MSEKSDNEIVQEVMENYVEQLRLDGIEISQIPPNTKRLVTAIVGVLRNET